MITNFKIFEGSDNNSYYYDKNNSLISMNDNGEYIRFIKPDVNNYSEVFWKFIKISDWNKIIKSRNNIGQKNKTENFKLKIRVFKNFEYDTIMSFYDEYEKLYKELFNYFKPIWLDEKYNIFMPSDDGYSDLISSVIGKGKLFIKKCINDHDVFINMAMTFEYVENFEYIWQTTLSEYDKIRTEYDPLYRDSKKFNL